MEILSNFALPPASVGLVVVSVLVGILSAGSVIAAVVITAAEAFPKASFTVSVTLYVPFAAYLWAGFTTFAVVPSPKSQRYSDMVPSGS